MYNKHNTIDKTFFHRYSIQETCNSAFSIFPEYSVINCE